MMTSIRMRLASILRRIANRLDPYDPQSRLFTASKTARSGLGGPGAADD